MKNIVIIIILLLCGSSYAEIRQKIDKDGNLVFYNVNKKAVVKTSNTSGKKYENSYERMIAAASMNTGVDAKLINCIIKVESNYNPKAISKAGAVGLMQLMPETASYYDVVDLTNPLENINAGTRHFAHLLNYFNGDIPLALAAYNAGLSRVNKQKKSRYISAGLNLFSIFYSLSSF